MSTAKNESPADVAKRIKEWLGPNGRENTASLLLYEAMLALEGIARAQADARPVDWLHRQGAHTEVSERELDDGEISRGWTQEPLYTALPKTGGAA